MLQTIKIVAISIFICVSTFSNNLQIFAQSVDPLFPNSIVSTDIDFILDTDEDYFTTLEFLGRENKEMPGNGANIFDEDTFVFEATFSNDKKVGIWCHSSFETEESAQEYADKLCPRLGKLPFVQRDMLDHVVINVGNHTAFAETEGHFFVLYSLNMDARITTHDLEETVFHESVHASLQDIYENDTIWTNAQLLDDNFITEYAQELPNLEDMPETAIFAYTMIYHPGRLDTDIENWVHTYIPHKLAFFEYVYGMTTGIDNENDNIEKSKILLYPNPSSDKTSIDFKESKKGRTLNIYSVKGEFIKTVLVEENQNQISVKELSNGLYYFSIPDNETVAFIKQ